MKFLWQSNAPWAGTGYGTQTKLLLKALQNLGQEPSAFAFYGLAGGPVEYDGYTVLPNSNFDDYGSDVIKAHIEHVKADLLITLMDLFVLSTKVYQELGVPWLAWTPIDSYGIGKQTLDRLSLDACRPVAMSSFGAQQMQASGIMPEAMIYHAVDTNVFKPLDKAAAREMLGIGPDEYVIGLVMANKGDRKQYPLQLQAIKLFQDAHPDVDVRVYLHTEPTAAMGGWDMRQLVDQIGLKGKVYSSNQYRTSVMPLEPGVMAQVMNSMDVLMNCSSGEGFGIPIIEAQACGIPVITHGVTAMPELTHYGYTVESASIGLGSHYGWMFAPDIDDMVSALESVYRMFPDKTLREAARVWVHSNCGIDKIASQWNDLIRGVKNEGQQIKQAAQEVFV